MLNLYLIIQFCEKNIIMFETDLNLNLVIKVAKIYSTLTNMF